MLIRKLRQERGWSQEQLSEMTDLSVRTIQRIEGGLNPSMETLRAIAGAFDTDVASLTTQAPDTESTSLRSVEEDQAIAYVQNIKGFYRHLGIYLAVISFLVVVNIIKSPQHLWVIWPAIGWGIGLALHGLRTFWRFKLFGSDWEKRMIKRHMEKNS